MTHNPCQCREGNHPCQCPTWKSDDPADNHAYTVPEQKPQEPSNALKRFDAGKAGRGNGWVDYIFHVDSGDIPAIRAALSRNATP